MSDGNTATQLAPSEDEMNKLSQFFGDTFGKMRDAVIAASALAAEVEGLRKSVADMRVEIEHIRDQNRWLDEQLTTVRRQRDEALAESTRLTRETRDGAAILEQALSRIDDQVQVLNRMDEQVAQLRKERDDALMAEMTAQEENEKLKGKLKAAKAIFAEEPEAEAAQPQAEAQHVMIEPEPERELPRTETGQFARHEPEAEQRQAQSGIGWHGIDGEWHNH